MNPTAFAPPTNPLPLRPHTIPYPPSISRRRPRACQTAPDASTLRHTLSHGTPPQRMLALLQLRKLPSATAVSLLSATGVLQANSTQIRVSALAALGEAGGREHADTLIDVLLLDADHSIRAAAGGALGALLLREGVFRCDDVSNRVTDALMRAAIHDDHFIVRYAAIVSAGNVGDPRAVDTLMSVVADLTKDGLEVAAAVTALGEVLDAVREEERVLGVVMRRAGDREDFVRAAVVRTLGCWKATAGVVECLERMRSDEEKYGQSEMVRVVLGDVLGEEVL